jgi:hypothetical protein
VAPLEESLSDLSEKFTKLQSATPGMQSNKEAGGKKKEFDWKTLRTFPVNYELSLKLSVLDLWICWHCGEDKTHGKDKTPYTTPAWKTISASDLKIVKGAKVLVSHMRHLCHRLDDAGRPGDKPTIAELRTLFQTEAVQAVFDPIRKTCTGQIRRVEQIHWDSITRLLVKAKANPHAVTKKRRQSSALSSSAFSTPPQKKAKQKPKKPIVKSSKVKSERTSSKEADSNDSDDEVECVSPPPDVKKGKSAFRVSKKNREFEVAGPDPTDEDCGRILLEQGDTDSLGRQGHMLTGCTTTAYLNLLVHKYHASKVRRSDDMFVTSVEGFLEAEGSKAGWTSYLTELYLQESGSKAIDWENDKLIVLQIFRGPVEAGHWASYH